MDNADLLKQLRIDGRHREEAAGMAPRWPWFVAVALLLVAVVAVAGWWWRGRQPLPVQTAVAVSPAKSAEAGAVLQATGYVTARRQATVSAQITGTLTDVLIEEGDSVARGQILARLEDSGYRADLDAARAGEQAAQAQVVQLQAELKQAEADASREEALVGRGLVSRQAAEQARTAVVSYHARIQAQQRQVAVAQAQARVAQVNYDYTVVRAPFAGVVTDKAAQVGEIVSPLSAGGGFTRTGVGTIVDMDSLEIDVDVNEAYIGRVQPGMPAEAVLDAYPDWTIPAHVIAIVPAADRGKATIKVRVAIEVKDARIVPDMGVRVSFLEKKAKEGIVLPKGVLVPAAAIVTRAGRTQVFVVDGGVAHTRPVTPSTQPYGDLRLIPAGVTTGATVVVSPPPALHDGSAVQNKSL